MSSCHCGQTGQWQLTKRNLHHTGCLHGKTILRMRAFRRKMAVCMAFNGGSAGSLQRRGFRENPTNSLTSIAR